MPLDPSFLLFVPGDRPDRFAKALAGGASGIILDLEDAVALERKQQARADVRAWLAAQDHLGRVCVRVNPPATPAGEADLGDARRRAPRAPRWWCPRSATRTISRR